MVGVAVNVTLVPAHIVEADAATDTAGVTTGFTVMVMPVEVAEVGEAQAAVDVIMQVTTSPFVNALLVYVALLVPALTPSTCHWYEGVPPLVGVAVNVTPVPEQIVVADGETATDGVTVVLIVATQGTRVPAQPGA